jgi:nucleotide-binding universal stress UspA family protein
MYRRILVALDNRRADESLLPHITQLAKIHRSELLLVHVADGWVARNDDQLQLRDSQEMKDDRAYLERVTKDLRATGLQVTTHLALGDPPQEILHTAREALRAHRADHPWPSAAQGHPARQHHRQGAPAVRDPPIDCPRLWLSESAPTVVAPQPETGYLKKRLAPQAGLEPATLRLTG